MELVNLAKDASHLKGQNPYHFGYTVALNSVMTVRFPSDLQQWLHLNILGEIHVASHITGIGIGR